MNRLSSYGLILLLAISHSLLASSDMHIVQGVLDELYEAHGDYSIEKPTIKITSDSNNAALYLRRSHIIEISQKTIEVCKNANAGLAPALSFVIGHELSHAYERSESMSPSFLASDHEHSAVDQSERLADINGLFMSHLAGYNVNDHLEGLIEAIYTAFELKAALKGYPNIDERKMATHEVKVLTDQLISLFELTSELLIIGKYDIAYNNLKYIERWYKGAEIYNNLALTQSLAALDISKLNIDPYIYPFELAWTTRLSKPKAARGKATLSDVENRKFEAFINVGIEYIDKSLEINPSFFPAHINKACLLIISGTPKEALKYIEEHQLRLVVSKDKYQQAKLESVIAIAYAHQEKSIEAKSFFNYLKSKFYGHSIADRAISNLKTLQNSNQKIPRHSKDKCEAISIMNNTIDNIRLHRVEWSDDAIALSNDQEGIFRVLQNSIVMGFRSNDDYFTMQSIGDLESIQHDMNTLKYGAIAVKDGWIMHCPAKSLLLKADKDFNLTSWSKYY